MENETNPNTEKASSINTLLCAGRAGSKPLTERFKVVGIGLSDGENEFVPSLNCNTIQIFLMIDDKPVSIYMSIGNFYGLLKEKYNELISSDMGDCDRSYALFPKIESNKSTISREFKPITNPKYLSITSQLQDLETQVNKLIEKFEEPHKLESGSKGVTVVLKQKQETWDKTIELGVIIDAKIL